MKKITFLVAMFFIATFSFSQTNLTTAVDFTENDANGVERHLFEILDGGQYVLIDFFYVDWPTCVSTAPYIAEAYTKYGCNTSKLFVISVSRYDNNAACITFDTDNNIEFPTISADEGNGAAICSAYGIGAYPTYILIAPDHSVVEQDMWPINSAADFDTFLSNNSIAESNCNATYIPNHKMEDIMSVYPNPSDGNFYLDINYNGRVDVKVTNIIGVTVFTQQLFVNNGMTNKINLSTVNNGIYFVTVKTDNASYVKKLKIIN